MQTRTDRMTGILLVLASAVAFSTAGILTKMITSGAWEILAWRGVVGGVAILIYIRWDRWRRGERTQEPMGWRGWLLAGVSALGSVCFINAFKQTYVANVAIAYATVPFMAALLEWVMLRRRARPVTLWAALASLAGVTLMMAAGAGTGAYFGDMLALGMTLMMALTMVLIRAFPGTPVVLAAAMASFLQFPIGWVLGDPFAVGNGDIVLLIAFGLVFALATVLLTEGTRRISAAESGLLGTAETPLALVLAWMVLSEIPPAASLTGGLIVITAVGLHAFRDWQQARRQTATAGMNPAD